MKAATLFVTLLVVAITAFAKLPPDWNMTGRYMALNVPRGSVDETLVLLYVQGLGDGYTSANALLEHLGKPQLYCGPNMPLNAENYRSVLDTEIKDLQVDTDKRGAIKLADLRSLPIALVLLRGLQDRFPCQLSGAEK